MSSPIPSPAPNKPPSKGIWPSVAPYVVPPFAASAAIIPVFRDMVAKSAQQVGKPVPSMTFIEGVKGGAKAAPTVGAIVGTQMVIQNKVEKALVGDSSKPSLFFMLASAAIVGTISAPVLAVFNGQTMGRGIRESLRKFSPWQGAAIAFQETAFVFGLSAADLLATEMRKKIGDTKVVDYTAAFVAGAGGSLSGHIANTALTRWQAGLTVDHFGQLMWGAARKARAIGCFSVLYKFGKETLNPTVRGSKQ
jgi:hypothetical protein